MPTRLKSDNLECHSRSNQFNLMCMTKFCDSIIKATPPSIGEMSPLSEDKEISISAMFLAIASQFF